MRLFLKSPQGPDLGTPNALEIALESHRGRGLHQRQEFNINGLRSHRPENTFGSQTYMKNKRVVGYSTILGGKTSKQRVLSAVAFFTFFAVALNVNAASYYVATTGSDGNTCTQARSTSTPKRTISNAVGCLVAGDTLYIRQGTYSGIDNNSTFIPSGTSWTNLVTISGYPGEQVVLSGGSTEHGANITRTGTQYISFENLIFDGFYQSISLANTVHHIRFKDIEAKNTTLHCVQVGKDSHYNWFIGGKYHNCGPSTTSGSQGTYGFYVSSSNNIFENLEVYDNAGFGFHFYYTGCSNCVNNNIVRNSIVYNSSFCGIIFSSGTNNIASNNILRNNTWSGLCINYNSVSNTKAYNNTIYGNGNPGIELQGSVNAVIKNNIIYQNGGVIAEYSTSGTIQSNNLTTDPKFVNAAGGNFRVQSASPSINAGTALAEVATDFDGVARPQGGAYDIGAFEYLSGGSTLPAPSNLAVTP